MPSAVRLRADYSAEELRALARRSKEVHQSRRLLSRRSATGWIAARRRDRRLRPADLARLGRSLPRLGSAGPHRQLDRRSQASPISEQLAQFAQIVEAGPDRQRDGVVRWRRIDLKRVSPSGSASTFIRAMSESFCISSASRT